MTKDELKEKIVGTKDEEGRILHYIVCKLHDYGKEILDLHNKVDDLQRQVTNLEGRRNNG